MLKKTDKFIVHGGVPLKGAVQVQKAKNAFLPIMSTLVMRPGRVRLKEAPPLRDTRVMQGLLESLGCVILYDGKDMVVDSAGVTRWDPPYDYVRQMRASFLLLGSLLARFGKAEVPLPGGCAIGTRPVHWHIEALEKVGCNFTINGGVVSATLKKVQRNCEVKLPFPSVGATQNLLTLVSSLDICVRIEGAAQEPEVQDLCSFLQKAGAKIQGVGTGELEVEGQNNLRLPSEYDLIPDRIETMTYAIAPLIAGGSIRIEKTERSLVTKPMELLESLGADVHWEDKNTVCVTKTRTCSGFNLKTEPYPGIPTDIQSLLMALALFCDSSSTIDERIFKNRFMHAMEMNRMGLNITIDGSVASIVPGTVQGAEMVSTDLRGGAGVVLAALGCPGQSVIRDVFHIDRGYVRLEEVLKSCGARIRRECG